MIAYASRTGNVRHIFLQLGLPGIEIRGDTTVGEPFLLLTYTDGLGEVPPVVEVFMNRNGAYCRGGGCERQPQFRPCAFRPGRRRDRGAVERAAR